MMLTALTTQLAASQYFPYFPYCKPSDGVVKYKAAVCG